MVPAFCVRNKTKASGESHYAVISASARIRIMNSCTLMRWLVSITALLLSCALQAELLPTSTTELSEESCRLDMYHLVKNKQNQFETELQLAMITDNVHRHRYIALKAALSHPSGFENISYYRSGQPVEVFTANWRKIANKYSVSRLVMLGGTSDRQAFDVFSRLIKEDQGHLELRGTDKRYQFNVQQQDLNAFFDCLDNHYQYANTANTRKRQQLNSLAFLILLLNSLDSQY